jgi:hypothetical protein
MRDSDTRATRWTWRSAKWFILATVALALFIGAFHIPPNPNDSLVSVLSRATFN